MLISIPILSIIKLQKVLFPLPLLPANKKNHRLYLNISDWWFSYNIFCLLICFLHILMSIDQCSTKGALVEQGDLFESIFWGKKDNKIVHLEFVSMPLKLRFNFK